MRVQLTLKFFRPDSKMTFMNTNWPFIPKEGQIDGVNLTVGEQKSVLEECCNILTSQHKKILSILPPHLKQEEFTAIVIGDFVTGYDFDASKEFVQWSEPQNLFNVLQMVLPEMQKPILQIARNQ